MSLNVPSTILARVKKGEAIHPKEFLDIIQDSLPNAWASMELLTKNTQNTCRAEETLLAGSLREGQILRACAGTAIRTALESHFNRNFSLSWDGPRLCIIAEKHPHPSELTLQEVRIRAPQGMHILERLSEELIESDFVCHAPRNMNPQIRRELLLLAGNTQVRILLQVKLGLEMAFQNCHASGGKRPNTHVEQYSEFISVPSQLLNQSPEMVDC